MKSFLLCIKLGNLWLKVASFRLEMWNCDVQVANWVFCIQLFCGYIPVHFLRMKLNLHYYEYRKQY